MSPKPLPNRRSIRLKGYDYAQEGLYFITICCQHRAHLFGEIENGKMILNDAGEIANQCWQQIPDHFPNVILHEHIIMPNHIHGIIELKSVGANHFSPENDVAPENDMGPENDAGNQYTANGANQFSPENDVGSENDPGNQYSANGAIGDSPENDAGNQNSTNGANENSANRANVDSPLRSPSMTIGSVIRGYKIGVTKWFRVNTDVQTVWQRNYYEHIIRDEQSYQNISEYIKNNPAKWHGDSFYDK